MVFFSVNQFSKRVHCIQACIHVCVVRNAFPTTSVLIKYKTFCIVNTRMGKGILLTEHYAFIPRLLRVAKQQCKNRLPSSIIECGMRIQHLSRNWCRKSVRNIIKAERKLISTTKKYTSVCSVPLCFVASFELQWMNREHMFIRHCLSDRYSSALIPNLWVPLNFNLCSNLSDGKNTISQFNWNYVLSFLVPYPSHEHVSLGMIWRRKNGAKNFESKLWMAAWVELKSLKCTRTLSFKVCRASAENRCNLCHQFDPPEYPYSVHVRALNGF